MNNVDLPIIDSNRITQDVINRVNAFASFVLVRENLEQAKLILANTTGLSAPTIHWYCIRLRNLFELPARTPLYTIAEHPQLRHALEYLFVRKDRSDKASLVCAKNLSVIVPSGELLSIESFLKSLYPREGVNATSCYLALRSHCLKNKIIKTVLLQESKESNTIPATLNDLPSQGTVIRFLRKWREEYLSVRMGRSRKNDFEANQQPYVTRDISKLRPGEVWIGDHTELDFMVLNEDGKPDRRWITAFIDQRTGLLIGYHFNWQPTSQTIAIAFRNGVLGSQIKAFTGTKFESIPISHLPENVMMDNGKDYRSNYTQRVFGKIDFDDSARLSVDRITKLHYCQPYHGQSKAQMERWFGTIQRMMKYLPGYKGNRYQNKPDSLATDLKSGAIMCVDDFDTAVALAINSYNNRPHRTLKGQTPLQCYLTNQTQQRSIDMHVLDFLMMKVQDRKIRRGQVTLHNKEYYSDALIRYNDQLADVYFDPNDLGFVSIYVNGVFAAVACNKEMIGRDERGWQRILHDRKHSQKQMNEELQGYKNNITDRQARTILLEGELLNMHPVSAELMNKNTASISYLTGLESQSKQIHNETKREKDFAEVQEKRKSKNNPLSLIAVNEKIT